MRFPTARQLLKEKNIPDDSPKLKRLPKWLKEAYLKDIPYCEETGVSYDLEVHRIKRACQGGLYNPDNVKILTKLRHKMHHANEYSNCKSK